jgi:hypothetical protein
MDKRPSVLFLQKNDMIKYLFVRSFERENRSSIYILFQSIFEEYPSLVFQLIFILGSLFCGFFLYTQFKHSLVVLVINHFIVRDKDRYLLELNSKASVL